MTLERKPLEGNIVLRKLGKAIGHMKPENRKKLHMVDGKVRGGLQRDRR